MYTPTHLLITLAAASLLKKSDSTNYQKFLVWSGIGSVLPDIPLVIQMVYNWLHGVVWLLHKNWITAIIGEIFHSLLVWSVMLILVELLLLAISSKSILALKFLSLGSIGHVLIDAITHGSGILGHSYLWPLNYRLGHLVGFWLYFVPGKTFSLKWWEVAIFSFSLAVFLKCNILINHGQTYSQE